MKKRALLHIFIWALIANLLYFSVFFSRHYLLNIKLTSVGLHVLFGLLSQTISIIFVKREWLKSWSYLHAVCTGIANSIITLSIFSLVQLLPTVGTDASSFGTTIFAHCLIYILYSLLISIFFKRQDLSSK